MAVLINSVNELKTTMNNVDFGDKIVFFKFGADWCVPCKTLEKNLKNIPGFNDILVYKISIDNPDFEKYMKENDIFNIPDTFVKYRKKNSRFKGPKTIPQLQEIINNLIN